MGEFESIQYELKKIKTRLKDLRSQQRGLTQYLDNFDFLFLGVVLGIIGGLWANVIDRNLSGIDHYLVSLLIVTSLIIFFILLKMLRYGRNAQNRIKEELKKIDIIQDEVEDKLKEVGTLVH